MTPTIAQAVKLIETEIEKYVSRDLMAEVVEREDEQTDRLRSLLENEDW